MASLTVNNKSYHESAMLTPNQSEGSSCRRSRIGDWSGNYKICEVLAAGAKVVIAWLPALMIDSCGQFIWFRPGSHLLRPQISLVLVLDVLALDGLARGVYHLRG